MHIKIIKDKTQLPNGKKLPKDKRLEVQNELGQKLIDEKKAVKLSDRDSFRFEEVMQKKIEKAEEK